MRLNSQWGILIFRIEPMVKLFLFWIRKKEGKNINQCLAKKDKNLS